MTKDLSLTFTTNTQGKFIGYLAPDCRTCANLTMSFDLVGEEQRDICDLANCTNGDQYQETTKVVLWRTE